MAAPGIVNARLHVMHPAFEGLLCVGMHGAIVRSVAANARAATGEDAGKGDLGPDCRGAFLRLPNRSRGFDSHRPQFFLA